MNCPTCNISIKDDSQFCRSCGAKIVRARLTFGSLFKNAFLSISNLDLPFFNTSWWLIRKPEKVTMGYINGVRKIFNSPIKYILIIISLYGVFQYFYSNFLNEMMEYGGLSGFKEAFEEDLDNPEMSDGATKLISMINWLQKHVLFINFFNIPIIALSTWLVYRKRKYNYAEHLVLACYIVGLPILIGVILAIISAPFRSDFVFDSYVTITGLLPFVYLVWVLKRSMKDKIYRPIFAMLVSMVAILFFILIGTMVVFWIAGV